MKKLNLFLTLGALFLATNMWGNNYYGKVVAVAETGKGKVWVADGKNKNTSSTGTDYKENFELSAQGTGRSDLTIDYSAQAISNSGYHFVSWNINNGANTVTTTYFVNNYSATSTSSDNPTILNLSASFEKNQVSWNAETIQAGEFYIYSPLCDKFMVATSTSYSFDANYGQATLFTFIADNSNYKISYDVNGTTNYLYHENGTAKFIQTPLSFTLENGSLYSGAYRFKSKNTDKDRWLSYDNAYVTFAKKDDNNSFSYANSDFFLISKDQMDTYNNYTTLKGLVETQSVSYTLQQKAQDLLNTVLSNSDPYTKKSADLQAVIEAYDAYAEVKDFLENVSGHDEQKAEALAALEVATTTEAIYAAKRMIVFPLTLVAENTQGYWATFSSDYDVEFSVGVTVYTVTVNGEAMELHAVDRQVPANTGVLIFSEDDAISYVAVAPVAALEDNMLQPGTGAETMSDVECRFYRLAYYNYAAKTGLGFYYGSGCDDGEAFMCKAGLAYLAVPKDMVSGNAPARFLLDRQDISTDLLNVNVNDNQGKKVMMNGVLYIIRDGKTYDSFGRMVK